MKKGFTIVELLVVIGLIAVVVVLVSTNILGLQGQQNEKEYENYIMTIENAACVYVESITCNNNCTITTEQLINEGLLDENLKNPMNSKYIKDEPQDINVSYPNNIKTCELEGK